MVAVPQLAAAVSNADALGTVTLTWSEDVGAVVRETAALTERPFCRWAGQSVALAKKSQPHHHCVGGSPGAGGCADGSPRCCG
jgi:NAD(P)H-dependent flavin oxidoreductase YrpB (nitropropane dioxygenase family)